MKSSSKLAELAYRVFTYNLVVWGMVFAYLYIQGINEHNKSQILEARSELHRERRQNHEALQQLNTYLQQSIKETAQEGIETLAEYKASRDIQDAYMAELMKMPAGTYPNGTQRVTYNGFLLEITITPLNGGGQNFNVKVVQTPRQLAEHNGKG